MPWQGLYTYPQSTWFKSAQSVVDPVCWSPEASEWIFLVDPLLEFELKVVRWKHIYYKSQFKILKRAISRSANGSAPWRTAASWGCQPASSLPSCGRCSSGTCAWGWCAAAGFAPTWFSGLARKASLNHQQTSSRCSGRGRPGAGPAVRPILNGTNGWLSKKLT